MKVDIINFNKDYNVIKIYRTDCVSYYLERIGCGDLFYIASTNKDIELSKKLVLEQIDIANRIDFWRM